MPIEDSSERCFSRFSERKTFFKKRKGRNQSYNILEKITLVQIIVKNKLKYFFQGAIFSML